MPIKVIYQIRGPKIAIKYNYFLSLACTLGNSTQERSLLFYPIVIAVVHGRN